MIKVDPIEVIGRALRYAHARQYGLKICDRMLADVHDIPVDPHEADRAMSLLEAFHPDCGRSCLTANHVEKPQYDIQVIMPVYNTTDTVCEAVESVLSQSGPEKTLLTIINDGSPDDSREKLRRYEGHPDIEIIDQENRGFSGARNAGLRHLRARYVTFLDSDDRLADGALHSLFQAAESNNSDIVQGGFRSFRPDGKTKGQWLPADSPHHGELLGFPWGKLFRSELFASVAFPENYWYEDTLMPMIIFPLARVKTSIAATVYHYRLNPLGITSKAKKSRRVLDSLWVTRRLFADRELLGIRPTLSDYESFLLQVRNNHRRVFRNGGNRVAHALFTIHRYLRQRYFSDPDLRRSCSPWHARADRALAAGDYTAFRLWVGLK